MVSHSGIDYERFNSNSVSIRCWSWNYRSCWHQTCLPVDPHCCFWIQHPSQTPLTRPGVWRYYFSSLSRQFLYWHWTICAPAAYLSSGGHLSGPLSGVEPIFSVTRHCHCGPLHHNRQLIGQKLATATQNAFCGEAVDWISSALFHLFQQAKRTAS